MMKIELTISSHQARCLSYDLANPEALFQSQVEARAAATQAEIVKLEVDRCLGDGTAIPSTPEAIVSQAFLRGTVTTRAERDAEAVSAILPTAE